MINFEQIFREYGISYNPNINSGWVNIHCPFCREDNYHLGFNIIGGYANCWKCGGHRLDEIFCELLHLSIRESRELIQQYTEEHVIRFSLDRKQPKALVIDLPGGELNGIERKYLQGREFDPDFLIQKYFIRGGGVVGRWRYRIIIPLILYGRIVSFTTRDITNKQKERYKNLSIEESILDPKTIFYNVDNAREKRVCVVEGPVDVWRMGDGFICSLGTSVTPAQINFLSRNYREIFIMFDPEPKAQHKARKIAEGLAIIGVSSWIIESGFDKDPGDLTNEQSIQLRRELGI